MTGLPLSHRISQCVTGGLIGAVLFVTGHHHFQFLTSTKPSSAIPNTVINANIIQNNQSPKEIVANLDSTSRPALMGEVYAPAPPAPAPEALPETQLSLELKGIFFSSQAFQRAALISINGTAPSYFRSGDEVIPGTELVDIYPDKISLRNGSTLEKLAFHKVDVSFDRFASTESNDARNYDSENVSKRDISKLEGYLGENSGISQNQLAELIRLAKLRSR